MKLYGRSLSFCVQDILNNEVKLEDVQCIMTSTRFKNFKELQAEVSFYMNSYWYGHTRREAIQVLYYLWFTGRIIQPRLIHDDWFHKLDTHNLWSTSIRDCASSLNYWR